MNFRCKFRHRRSIRRPQFPIRVQNFGDLSTFSVDYCILYAECPPYFYFRFVWPTDLESIPRSSTPTSIIATKFEDLRLSVLELWVITFPNGYHWKCVQGHCACAESRNLWVGGQKQLHFWNPRPRFAYSLYNFYSVTMTIKGRLLSSVTNAKALDCVNFFCVTMWPWPLTFWPWTVVVHGGSRAQPCHQIWRP